jgi:serine/threonine protein kinase
MNYELHPHYQHLCPLVDNIEHYFQQSSAVLHQARNELRVVEFADEAYVIKAFKIPHLVNRFAYRYLRDSKAKRSYHYSLKLGAELCPEAVAYSEYYKKGGLDKSYYISRYFQYDYTIRSVLNHTIEHYDDVLQQFAAFTFKLHEKNILHRDYSPGNVLVKEQEEGVLFKVVDVNRMQFKKLTLKDRLFNFVRLTEDDMTLQIIISHYAQLIQADEEQLLQQTIAYRDQYLNKRALKNKLRGR